MSLARLALAAVLAAALAVSGCGVKGEPVRPAPDDDPKTETTN